MVTASLSAEVLETRLLLTTAAVGEQFLVAETSAFTPGAPVTAISADGSFVTAWESYEQDGNGFGIFARRFDAGGNPLGVAPFQVNTQFTGDQSAPAIAGDSAGNVLIVWQGPDASGMGVFGQWYDNTGAAVGTEFAINSTVAGDQRAPSVAMDASGHAVVAWQSDGQDGDGWGVYYTRLDSVGDTTGTEIKANNAFAGAQQAPSVAVAGNGNFVIAWEAIDPLGGDDASLDIYAKVYDSAGATIAGELKVNTESLRDQVTPQVAADNSGDFAVVWVSEGIPGSGSDVFGQRFNSAGVAQGSEFRVNNTTLASQVGGTIAMDAGGNFLVTWQSVNQDGFSEGVFGREYNADGTTLVDEFLVNTTVEGPQTLPSVSMNQSGQTVVTWIGPDATHNPAVFAQRYSVPNTNPAFKVGTELKLGTLIGLEENGPSAAMDIAGNSVVVWDSYGQDGDGWGVYGRLLDAVGEPLGNPFLVNSGFTAGTQNAPSVARAADGQFVVVWQSVVQDTDGYGIFARRYAADGTAIGAAF